MLNLTELKLSVHIIRHRRMNPIDFGKNSMYSFFTRVQKIDIHYLLRSQLIKKNLVFKLSSIELKFGVYIIDYYSVY